MSATGVKEISEKREKISAKLESQFLHHCDITHSQIDDKCIKRGYFLLKGLEVLHFSQCFSMKYISETV